MGELHITLRKSLLKCKGRDMTRTGQDACSKYQFRSGLTNNSEIADLSWLGVISLMYPTLLKPITNFLQNFTVVISWYK